jgi:DNA-binding LacI/PurR family transcriptional regulator
MALNENPLVRSATRAHILETAQRLGYTRHPMARRLATRRSDCLCVAFATGPENVFYWEVMQGIMEAAEREGYRLSFSTPHPATATADADLPAIDPADIDGILVLNWHDRYVVHHLLSFDVPVVLIDASGDYADVPAVDNDDRRGVYLGVEYLIDLGHRRIGFLGTPLTTPFGREVWQGYLEAMAAANLSIDPHLLVTADFTMEGGMAAAETLLHLTDPPSGIMAVTDEMAIGVMRVAQRHGLAIPGDLSVMGMDDIHLAALVEPPLTTVRIDRHALGLQATEMVIRMIRRRYDGPAKIVLPPHVVARASCGVPRRIRDMANGGT